MSRSTHWGNVAEVGFAFGTWFLCFVDRFLGSTTWFPIGPRVPFEKLAERVDLCRESPYDRFNFFPFWEPPRA